MPELLVAIQTKTHAGHYVHMTTGNPTSFSASGSGHVNCNSTSITDSETFILELNPNGTVSFRSIVSTNCYLSMSEVIDNGGSFNCRFGKAAQEEFRIMPVGKENKAGVQTGAYKGIVGIESATHDRRWLRIHSDGKVTAVGSPGYPFVELLVVGVRP